MYTLPCSKCKRQAAGMDAHGPIPAGTLMIHTFNPTLCVDCAAGVKPTMPFIIRHDVTEKEFTVLGSDAGDAVNQHLHDLELEAGKLLSLDTLKLHVSHLTVRSELDPRPQPALDAMLLSFIRSL